MNKIKKAFVGVILSGLLITGFASQKRDTQGKDKKRKSSPSIYDFVLKDIDGNKVPLKKYKGKAMLIVNVASRCGFTPQYEGLQRLYEKYKDQGFVILGFPANNFLNQEPGSNKQIKKFCKLKYGVTFPMFSKISVKGKDKAPLYRYLTDKKTNPKYGGEIKWNFTKFLIAPDGECVARFEPATEPESAQVVKSIEQILPGKNE